MWTTQRIVEYLLAYEIWQGELANMGMYQAQEGSQIKSTRRGNPTQRAAFHLLELPEKCATVKAWLDALRWYERVASEHYSANKPIAAIAHELSMSELRARVLVNSLPMTIYQLFYAEEERELAHQGGLTKST